MLYNMTKLDINVNGHPNRRLLGFSSLKVMKAALRMSKNAVMDATFKDSPNGFHQLFIISMLIGGLIWRPVLYVFMTDKYQDSYQTMFQGLNDFMIQNEFSWNRELKIMCDWDIAEYHA